MEIWYFFSYNTIWQLETIHTKSVQPAFGYGGKLGHMWMVSGSEEETTSMKKLLV